MAGKEETPTCRKKTVTWTNEMIEDLIDNLNLRNLNGDLDAKLASCIPGLTVEVQ
jgi:hypothetical protein